MQILVQQGEKYMPAEAVFEALRQQYAAERAAGRPGDYLGGFAALARGLKAGVDTTSGPAAPTTQSLLRAASTRAYGEQKGAGEPFKQGLAAASRAVFNLAGADASGQCAYCRKLFTPADPDDQCCSKRCRSRFEDQ